MTGKYFKKHRTFVPPASDIPLDIMMRWAGHQQVVSTDYRFDGMHRGSQPLVLWQYTISGFGMVELDGRMIPVDPGEAFLLVTPEKHRYFFPETSENWEFLYLGMCGDEACRIARELRKKYGSVSSHYGSAASVNMVRQVISGTAGYSTDTPVQLSSIAYNFMMSLITGGSSGRSNRSDSDILNLIHNYCIEHLADPVSVGDLAGFAGCSRSHFCRVFSQASGKSPHEYLLELRIRMATRMLQNGNFSVKQIASECGFNETGYFCKVFRRYHGTTPADFRRKTR